MTAKIASTSLVLLLCLANCLAACPVQQKKSVCLESSQTDPIEAVLKNLNKATMDLATYQAKLEYRVREPEYDTQKLRTGELFYAKDPNSSKLRVNFETLKVDDERTQKQVEQYIFDGVWLTQIKFQIKEARRIQQTEPNKPVDAFELLSSRFPVIGFARIEDLRKDFDVKFGDLPPDQKDKFILLRLKVKPGSKYSEDYTAMDFWIDAKLFLPSKISAVAAVEDQFIQPDIHEIAFVKPLVNQPIDPKTFEFKIPKDFNIDTQPLKDNP